VSGWDGDPGPAGHLVFQEREGHYLISTEQWPRHYFRLVKDEFSSYLHVVGKRGEPGKAGQFVIEEMPGYFLISSKQWPEWFLFVDELGRLRAEPGDPGSKGHFLLNRKIPQESDGLSLPPIIQTMYLIHNKDREHSAAMSLLSNQKEEVRAREVAVLQAQMASERAASEATLDDTRREHGEACDVLNQEMQQQQATARNVLEERDRNHCNDVARREAEHSAALAALRRQMEEAQRAAEAHLRDVNWTHACEVEALRQLHKAELRAIMERKDAELKAALANLRGDLEALHEAEIASLRSLFAEEKKVLTQKIDEKDKIHQSELDAVTTAKDRLFEETTHELERKREAEIHEKDRQHDADLQQLATEKDTTWALAMSNMVAEKDVERREIVAALTNHFQAQEEASKFKILSFMGSRKSLTSPDDAAKIVAKVTSERRKPIMS